jgi:hypothetical protein
MAVFWDVAPCSLVEVYRRFRDACCLHYQSEIALMMEAASTFETSVNFYQKTRRNILEDGHLEIIFFAMTVSNIHVLVFFSFR